MNGVLTVKPDASDGDLAEQLSVALGALSSLLRDHLCEPPADECSRWGALYLAQTCEALADGLNDRFQTRAFNATKAAAPAAQPA